MRNASRAGATRTEARRIVSNWAAQREECAAGGDHAEGRWRSDLQEGRGARRRRRTEPYSIPPRSYSLSLPGPNSSQSSAPQLKSLRAMSCPGPAACGTLLWLQAPPRAGRAAGAKAARQDMGKARADRSRGERRRRPGGARQPAGAPVLRRPIARHTPHPRVGGAPAWETGRRPPLHSASPRTAQRRASTAGPRAGRGRRRSIPTLRTLAVLPAAAGRERSLERLTPPASGRQALDSSGPSAGFASWRGERRRDRAGAAPAALRIAVCCWQGTPIPTSSPSALSRGLGQSARQDLRP